MCIRYFGLPKLAGGLAYYTSRHCVYQASLSSDTRSILLRKKRLKLGTSFLSPIESDSLKRDRRTSYKEKVFAYNVARHYDLAQAEHNLTSAHFHVNPFKLNLAPYVLHAQNVASTRDSPEDIFVFSSGVLVTWNLNEQARDTLLHETLRSAGSTLAQTIEQDHLDYTYVSTIPSSRINGDTIQLCIRSKTDTIPLKLAYSLGLARSTKLQSLESQLDDYFSSLRQLPELLSRAAPLPLSRRDVLCKIGELLSLRGQLNLYSELTDSLPDLLWDAPQSLGLESCYEQLSATLDVDARIRVLNQRMDYAQEMVSVLQQNLSEKHSLRLEWSIILLIAVEVLFELWHLFKDSRG